MNKHQKIVQQVFEKNSFEYFHPLSQFARLAEEVGELARILNHLYGDKPKKVSEDKQNLQEEIGDVLFTVICLANSTGVDLDEAVKISIDKLVNRDKIRYSKKLQILDK